MLNIGARKRVLGIGAEGGLAAVEVGKIVDGQRRVVIKSVAAGADVGGALLGARGSLDSDWGAVHVVLLGARQFGGPGPGVTVCAGGDVGGNGNVVGAGGGAVLGRAATLDGENNAPPGRLGGLHVGGQGDLTGAAAVDGRALERHGDALARRHFVADATGRVEGASIAADLAGVVGPGGRKGTVGDGVGRVWSRVRQNHVGRGGRPPERQNGAKVVDERRHFGCQYGCKRIQWEREKKAFGYREQNMNVVV